MRGPEPFLIAFVPMVRDARRCVLIQVNGAQANGAFTAVHENDAVLYDTVARFLPAMETTRVVQSLRRGHSISLVEQHDWLALKGFLQPSPHKGGLFLV